MNNILWDTMHILFISSVEVLIWGHFTGVVYLGEIC